MATKKPNIVMIYADNHPGAVIGDAGNAEAFTPNLDRLSQNATLFTEAYSPNAMCSPCRASVLTGLMPSQHGIHTWIDGYFKDDWPDNWNAIEEFDTLPEKLAREGYDTALIGKYHLGNAESATDIFKKCVTMQIGHVQSFYENDIIDGEERYKHPGHSVDFFTDKAIDYIDQCSEEKEKPFFLFLTYPAPYGHWPAIQGEPVNRYADRFSDSPMLSVPREGISKQMIDWISILKEKGLGDDEYDAMLQIPNDLPTLRNYYSQISIVDDGVGRVLEALENKSLADDTLFIYASDHGMSLGQHGFWGHGEDTWPSNTHREANHIPLIIKAPDDGNKQKVVDSLVGTTDIYATILDYVGLEMHPIKESPARSMRPLIENENIVWDNACFMEQEETRAIRTSQWLFMMRIQNTKYEFKHELYDLVNDPDERVDLAQDPEYVDLVAKLSARLNEFFSNYANPRWDLWKGGVVKSNSSRPFLWKETWGDRWAPEY
jgi:arylsulfatase A-like enzyme